MRLRIFGKELTYIGTKRWKDHYLSELLIICESMHVTLYTSTIISNDE